MKVRMNNDMFNDMRDMQQGMFKAIPWWFKLLWCVGALLSLAFVGLVCWGLYEGICWLQAN